MNVISIKRNLRQLKRQEQKIRSEAGERVRPALVWDAFFDLQNKGKAKYSLQMLAGMNRAEYHKIIGEYWSFVYRTFFSENEFPIVRFDTKILLRWGLSGDADEMAVKRRFRTLAKQHHPDTGGNADDFIQLMTEYRTLIGK